MQDGAWRLGMTRRDLQIGARGSVSFCAFWLQPINAKHMVLTAHRKLDNIVPPFISLSCVKMVCKVHGFRFCFPVYRPFPHPRFTQHLKQRSFQHQGTQLATRFHGSFLQGKVKQKPKLQQLHSAEPSAVSRVNQASLKGFSLDSDSSLALYHNRCLDNPMSNTPSKVWTVSLPNPRSEEETLPLLVCIICETKREATRFGGNSWGGHFATYERSEPTRGPLSLRTYRSGTYIQILKYAGLDRVRYLFTNSGRTILVV